MPDDLDAVARLLAGQALCRECIGHKVDLVPWRVDDVISRLGSMIKTSAHVMDCDGCRQLAVVYTLP